MKKEKKAPAKAATKATAKPAKAAANTAAIPSGTETAKPAKAAKAASAKPPKLTKDGKVKKPRAPRGKKALPELCIFKDCTPDTRKFQGLCRKCYLSNWQTIKGQKQEKAQRRLNAYVEAITKKYPDDYLERIRDGLENEDAFQKMVAELELAEDGDAETEREFLEKFSRKIRNED